MKEMTMEERRARLLSIRNRFLKLYEELEVNGVCTIMDPKINGIMLATEYGPSAS